jgi:hypothetical protein
MEEATEERGFRIDTVLYPLTVEFTVNDGKLVRGVTGMRWQKFLEGVVSGDWDQDILLGLAAVAVAHVNNSASVERIADWFGQLEQSKIEPVGIFEDELETAEDDAGPPDVTEENDSSTSAPSSNGTPEENSETPIPASSGIPESVIGSPV